MKSSATMSLTNPDPQIKRSNANKNSPALNTIQVPVLKTKQQAEALVDFISERLFGDDDNDMGNDVGNDNDNDINNINSNNNNIDDQNNEQSLDIELIAAGINRLSAVFYQTDKDSDPVLASWVAGAIETILVASGLSHSPRCHLIHERLRGAFSKGLLEVCFRFMAQCFRHHGLEAERQLLQSQSTQSQSTLQSASTEDDDSDSRSKCFAHHHLRAVAACWSLLDAVLCEDSLCDSRISNGNGNGSDSTTNNRKAILQRPKKLTMIDACLRSTSQCVILSTSSPSSSESRRILVHVLSVLHVLLYDDDLTERDFEGDLLFVNCIGVLCCAQSAEDDDSSGDDDEIGGESESATTLAVMERALQILVVCAKSHTMVRFQDWERLATACGMALVRLDGLWRKRKRSRDAKAAVDSMKKDDDDDDDDDSMIRATSTRILECIVDLIELEDAAAGLWLRHTYGIFPSAQSRCRRDKQCPNSRSSSSTNEHLAHRGCSR